MAIKTITLRPTGSEYIVDPALNIAIESLTYPPTTEVSEIYLRVNEEVADGDSTYYKPGYTVITDSIGFSFTPPENYSSLIPVSLRIYLNVTSEYNADVMFISLDASSGTESLSEIFRYTIPASTTYNSVEYVVEGEHIDEIWKRVSSANPSLWSSALSIRAVKANASKTANTKITQFYIEADFEVEESSGIYVRKNGAFVEVAQTYKKVSGAWTEITTEECKSLIQSHS